MRTMGHSQMSVAGLLLLAGLVAVGSAALRNSSAAWAGGMLLATLGMLGMSILGVIYRSGGERAWWLGCALFGSGYLALAFSPAMGQKLPTTRLLVDAYYTQFIEAGQQGHVFRFASTGTGSVRLTDDSGSSVEADEFTIVRDQINTFGPTKIGCTRMPPWHFLDVAHCEFTWLAALVGALSARWFHATRRATAQHP